MLQALEELALNYDQKLQEVDQKTKDNETLMEDLSTEQANRQSVGKELENLQERMHVMTKKVTEITNTLLGELVTNFWLSFYYRCMKSQSGLIFESSWILWR